MLESNPFSVFCPPKAKYFILGSFAAKDGKQGVVYDWYYSNGRNQFWRLLEQVYSIELQDIFSQQALFAKHSIAIADIILRCERVGNSSLDMRLKNIEYNLPAITEVFRKNPIRKVFFTSRFVETHFRKHFKQLLEEFGTVEFLTLPSPSPRYATMSKAEKVKKYAAVFPK